MNFPAIAKQTFDLLKENPMFSSISDFIILHLKKIDSPTDRAQFVHDAVDDYNLEVFAHPLVKELVACKIGCSACCHTQVSITEDESELLAQKVLGGIKIDYALLRKQMSAKNEENNFNKLSYEDRKCVFLAEDRTCQVYDDRPSVCRTNAVLGSPSQCSPNPISGEKQTLRLVKTSKADMAIIASFIVSHSSGTLASMLGNTLFKKKSIKKYISNDSVL